MNAVRLFVNACSCSVFGSVFDVERVRCPCSGLNVFAVLHQNCCVRCSASGVVLCSVFAGSSFKSSSSFKSRHHASHFKRESGYQGISRSVLELRSTLGAQIIEQLTSWGVGESASWGVGELASWRVGEWASW